MAYSGTPATEGRYLASASSEGFEDGWRAEHQIRGVLDLRETPMVGLSEHIEHRTALLGVPIEDATQHVGREAIGKGLRALPVVDAQEGVRQG